MKKIISLLVAAVMLFAVSSATATAFAKEKPIWSIETTTKQTKIEITVNGQTSIDGTFIEVDPDENGYHMVIEFTYSGDGTIDRWEFEGLVEGVDYVILNDDGNVIRVAIINPDIDYVKANVITTDGKKETASQEINHDRTSPDTGASGAVGIAVMAAGASLLALRRKNK